MSRTGLRHSFDSLASLPDSGKAAEKRRRGRQFEGLLRELLDTDGVSPRIRIRPDGEEIDGSFVLNDRVFLLEAKWHATPIPASTIYEFKGKVDGKLVGTLGIFISMSGFTRNAVDALTVGKELNVVLFDRSDIEAAIDIQGGFRTVLLTKLRVAAERGIVYFLFRSSLASPDSPKVEIVEEAKQPISQDVIVLVEGTTDEQVLAELTQRIIKHEDLAVNVRFLAAGGKRAIPRLSSLAQGLLSARTSLIVVADTDGDRQGTEQLLNAGLKNVQASLILVEPELEAWFFPGAESPRLALREKARCLGKSPTDYAREMSKTLPLQRLRKGNSDFAAFYEAILRAAKLARKGVKVDRPQAGPLET
jgi:hypothetical protein